MSITSGSGLRELDVDELWRRIASDLIPCEKTVVGRAVLFSPVLVRGYWKTKGVQILPVPAQAPRADILVGKHQPFLLEFEFRTSESASIRIGRRVRRLHELALLLNAVLVPGVVDLGMRARFHWVLKHTTDTTSGITYECAQEGYGYEGLRLEGDSFSPVNGLPKLSEVELKKYFAQRGIRIDAAFQMPAELDRIIEAFDQSPPDRREQLLRSFFWFRHASIVSTYSQSDSFLALIYAIEGLLPAEDAEVCRQCSRPLGSVGRRFAEFLDGIEPADQEIARARRQLYAVRSKLSHGGDLLRSDLDPWMTFDARRLEEMHQSWTAFRLARLAIVRALGLWS